MRVISGLARGHKLVCPEGASVRPTSDRAKEAIFSALGARVYGSHFLDVFSGSGAVGIEAISRGAEFVAFIESEPAHSGIILRNLAHISKAVAGADYKVLTEDAAGALTGLSASSLAFDIIFLDPPYKSGLLESALRHIYELSLLKTGGIIAAETGKDEKEPSAPHFNIIKKKTYGAASVYYMEIDK